MTASSLLNAAGRRRSPVSLPGYLAGRRPRNKGLRYPPDPPTVEEIVAVMRAAGEDIHGARMRALVVLLSRAGLRINEALTLTEHDLDPRLGAILVRHGKGGRRREVGMDTWAWEHLRPWLELRMRMPVGPLLCVIDGRTRGRPWASDAARARLRRVALEGRCAQAVRALPAAPRTRGRACPRRRPAQRHPAPVGGYQPRRHVDLSTRHRQRRDHRDRARPQGADDPRQHRAAPLGQSTQAWPRPRQYWSGREARTGNRRACWSVRAGVPWARGRRARSGGAAVSALERSVVKCAITMPTQLPPMFGGTDSER
jgi:integrase